MIIPAKAISTVGTAFLLAACATPPTGHPSPKPSLAPVAVDLRVRENAEAPYVAVNEFTVPASHEIGDGMMPYEGIGWENGLVGYRLYLDGRLVSDIFGKQVSRPVLSQIDRYGSYHELAPWGMDVLKVGPSLGIGGLGIMRNGQPAQFGSVPVLSATISKGGGDKGIFTIIGRGIEAFPGITGGFTATYAIKPASPMTRVSVKSDGSLPLASGIVMHDGAAFWQSDKTSGDWRYIATWGKQSENKDGLGMALFYRAGQARYGGLANSTHYVAFDSANFDYGFLAAWERDPMEVKTREAFKRLLDEELASLEGASK